jgi:hypothetical protein
VQMTRRRRCETHANRNTFAHRIDVSRGWWKLAESAETTKGLFQSFVSHSRASVWVLKTGNSRFEKSLTSF